MTNERYKVACWRCGREVRQQIESSSSLIGRA